MLLITDGRRSASMPRPAPRRLRRHKKRLRDPHRSSWRLSDQLPPPPPCQRRTPPRRSRSRVRCTRRAAARAPPRCRRPCRGTAVPCRGCVGHCPSNTSAEGGEADADGRCARRRAHGRGTCDVKSRAVRHGAAQGARDGRRIVQLPSLSRCHLAPWLAAHSCVSDRSRGVSDAWCGRQSQSVSWTSAMVAAAEIVQI